MCQIEGMPLGTNLRRLRHQRDLTQAEVAEAVHVSRSTLAGIENGKDHPGRETLQRLAKFYGVTMDALYSAALPVGARPKPAERVKDEDEAALISFWRELDEPNKRLFLLALARGHDGGTSNGA
jgi:transcriptional regulator with XRE-family HTH domain